MKQAIKLSKRRTIFIFKSVKVQSYSTDPTTLTSSITVTGMSGI
ncbi:hypothetical protein OQX64_07205 [Pedobacter sp. GR22-10]|nr:hypothetical protein [Pedobacter sp. GR22-10]